MAPWRGVALRAGPVAALCAGMAAALAQPLVIDNTPAAPPVTGSSAEAQAALARADAKGALTLRARSVSVQGRWMARLAPPLARCALLTPQSISAAMHAVREAVTAPDAALRASGSAGEVEVFWVDVDFVDPRPGTPADCDGAPTVAVVLRPLHLRVPTERLGDSVLPLARSALGTAYAQVPEALLVLNPALTAGHDRALGSTLGVALRVPLPALAHGVEAHAEAKKSIAESYFDAAGGLSWRQPQAGAGLLAEYRLRIAAAQRRVPLGDGVLDEQAGELGAGITLRLAPTSRLWLDTAWQSRRDELARPASASVSAPSVTRTDAWSSRALADRLWPDTLTYLRAAVWHEQVAGTRSVTAGLGVAREFRLQPGRLVGVEAGLRIGRADEATPSERRFRGGPPAGQFLYEGTQSPGLLVALAGPQLRSVGTAQAQLGHGAAARGGTRFWSASLDVALPVAQWFRPLIPDETTDLQIADDQPPLTLKRLLMTQVDVTGPNMLAAELMRQGLSAEEARARAHASLAQVRPAVRYLVEDAPLFAVRPLLMIDAAGLADGGTGPDASAHWVAVGIGAQVQLATARFEAGWMQTVSGPVAGDARGALVLRLTFQNLF